MSRLSTKQRRAARRRRRGYGFAEWMRMVNMAGRAFRLVLGEVDRWNDGRAPGREGTTP